MQILEIQKEKNDPLCTAFPMEGGVFAFVGGGGKTSCMLLLAKELAKFGSVIVTTSTHIFPPDGMRTLHNPTEDEVRVALTMESCVCVGKPEAASGKLTACDIPFTRLQTLADTVLVEADGAKGFPLKAPAEHEPVLPENTSMVIAVAGMDGVGKPIAEAAFRPERYAANLGTDTAHRVTPEDVARVLCSANGQYKGVREPMRFAVLLNKADTPERKRLAWEIVECLDQTRVERVVIASCKEMLRCSF